jgi:hypothetical protein
MLTGRDAVGWRRLLLVALLVVLLPVAAGVGVADDWLVGPSQISDDDGPARSVPDVAASTRAALAAPAPRPGPSPPAVDDGGTTSRPGLATTDRAPPRVSPSLA